MNLNQFTQKSLEAIQSAQSLAVENGNQQGGQSQLLVDDNDALCFRLTDVAELADLAVVDDVAFVITIGILEA